MSCVLTDEQSGLITAAAAAAPSIHNSRPWQVITNGRVVLVGAAPDRALWVSDPTGRALCLSCGAALENVRLAVRGLACEPAVRLLPHPDYPFDILAEVIVAPGEPAGPEDRTLLDAMARRDTGSRPYTMRPVPAGTRDLLNRAAEDEAAMLRWPDRAAAAPQLAVLATAADEPADWLRAGQALQRVLLTATAHGVSASFPFPSVEQDDGVSIWQCAENPQMVIRFGYTARPVPAPRPGHVACC